MKEDLKDYYQEEKAKKEFLIFDRGLTELKPSSDKEKEKKKPVNWHMLYKILFKNILTSKDVIPIDELVLRFNIIRQSLPKFHKGYKGNESNSSAIIRKFTYHIYKNKKLHPPKKINIEDDDNDIFSLRKSGSKNNSNANMPFSRRGAKTKTVKVSNKLHLDFVSHTRVKSKKTGNKAFGNLEMVDENKNFNFDDRVKNKINKKYNLGLINNEKKSSKNQRFISNKKTNDSNLLKGKTNKVKSNKIDTNSVQIKFKNSIDVSGMCENEILLGTPNDTECPLILSQKRVYNNKPSFFYESLNKIKELTKQEKIKTYKKEFTSQILKFNDLYFDPKIDDFYNDKLFNDVKATCDLFINKFNIDPQEEKNLAEMDNYL